MKLGRSALVIGLLWLSAPVAAQTQSDVARNGRDLARVMAYRLHERIGDRMCDHPIHWVIAFDISASTAGTWHEWVSQAVNDLVKYTLASGDLVEWLPFDDEVDPKTTVPRQHTLAGSDRGAVTQAFKGLFEIRPKRTGTNLEGALYEALVKASRADRNRLGVALLLADRPSDDQADPDSDRGRFGRQGIAVPGMAAPTGSSLVGPGGKPRPFSCDYFVLGAGGDKRIELFVSVAERVPAQPRAVARQVPPRDDDLSRPASPRPPSDWRPLCFWLLIVVMLVSLVIGGATWMRVGLVWEKQAATFGAGSRALVLVLAERTSHGLVRLGDTELETPDELLLTPLAELDANWRDRARDFARLGKVRASAGRVTVDPDPGFQISVAADERLWHTGSLPLDREFDGALVFSFPNQDRDLTAAVNVRLESGRGAAGWLVFGVVIFLLSLIVKSLPAPAAPPAPADSPVEWLCGP